MWRRAFVLTTMVGFSVASLAIAAACTADVHPPADPTDASRPAVADAEAGPVCPTHSHPEAPKRPLRILFLSKETLYYHTDAHDAGDRSMSDALRSRGHDVTWSNDFATYFTAERLAPFDVILYFVTSGPLLDAAQRATLRDWVHRGKGLAGTHTAIATDTDWQFMRDAFGAVFLGHGQGKSGVTEAGVLVASPPSAITAGLPARWTRADEWYYYVENPAKNPNVRPLLLLDEADIEPFRGDSSDSYLDVGFYGKEGHPLAWTLEYECGRTFYSALGHTGASWTEPLLIDFVARGVEWAGAPSSELYP